MFRCVQTHRGSVRRILIATISKTYGYNGKDTFTYIHCQILVPNAKTILTLVYLHIITYLICRYLKPDAMVSKTDPWTTDDVSFFVRMLCVYLQCTSFLESNCSVTTISVSQSFFNKLIICLSLLFCYFIILPQLIRLEDLVLTHTNNPDKRRAGRSTTKTSIDWTTISLVNNCMHYFYISLLVSLLLIRGYFHCLP